MSICRVLLYVRRLFDNSKLNCAEKHINVQHFYSRIYEAVAKTSEYLSPEVVVMVEQLVSVSVC